MAYYGVSWHITHLLREYYSHICSTVCILFPTKAQSQNPKITVFATLQYLLTVHVTPNRSILTVSSPSGLIPGVSMNLQYLSFIVVL